MLVLGGGQLLASLCLLQSAFAVVPRRYYAWCQRAEITAEPTWETAMVDVIDDHQRQPDNITQFSPAQLDHPDHLKNAFINKLHILN